LESTVILKEKSRNHLKDINSPKACLRWKIQKRFFSPPFKFPKNV
jgi:hypothetical protein